MLTAGTWIDIDLDALAQNYRTACSLTKASVCCVLKANAYGHGALRVAQSLTEAGASSYAVSCAREAFQLRDGGIDGDILVMGMSAPEEKEELIRRDISVTAAEETDLYDLDREAARLGSMARVHLKFDTGFHRLGFSCEMSLIDSLCITIKHLHHIRIEAIYTHLGLADKVHDEAQHDLFQRTAERLKQNGINGFEMHICDSIGLVRYPEWHGDRCRVGALLFGVRPSRSEKMPFSCLETLTFCTTVTQIHDVKAGELVGYSEILTKKPMRVATLCAGYGDGYPRHLSDGRGKVLIRGKLAPTVGLICMDQMMVDVSDIPDCSPGDRAVLLGGGIPYGVYADWAETNRNECLTILSRRPLRRYWQSGRIVTKVDELLGIREDIQ